MNKLSQVFSGGKAFIPFIMGGDPNLEVTEQLLYTLSEAGADAIEIGIPFSDPVAEGPVIEAAAARALAAGCTTTKLFELAARVSAKIQTPLLFMTYYNPVFVYGVDKFTRRCAECGISGLIVPDLPFEERDELLGPCAANSIELISLIAPTSQARIEQIAKNSSGFLYCVSSLGVTGERKELGDSARQMIGHVRRVSDIPCAVGFGISESGQARHMAQFADGVIVGSAIVRLVAEFGENFRQPVSEFAKSIKQEILNL